MNTFWSSLKILISPLSPSFFHRCGLHCPGSGFLCSPGIFLPQENVKKLLVHWNLLHCRLGQLWHSSPQKLYNILNIMRILKLSVGFMQWPSASYYSPFPTLEKPIYCWKPEKKQVPWNFEEWWSSVSISSPHARLIPWRCQCQCRSFLRCWSSQTLGGASKDVFKATELGVRCLAASRILEVTYGWDDQDAGICHLYNICTAIKFSCGPQLATPCASQGVIQVLDAVHGHSH